LNEARSQPREWHGICQEYTEAHRVPSADITCEKTLARLNEGNFRGDRSLDELGRRSGNKRTLVACSVQFVL
jgi:hypothetical protein